MIQTKYWDKYYFGPCNELNQHFENGYYLQRVQVVQNCSPLKFPKLRNCISEGVLTWLPEGLNFRFAPQTNKYLSLGQTLLGMGLGWKLIFLPVYLGREITDLSRNVNGVEIYLQPNAVRRFGKFKIKFLFVSILLWINNIKYSLYIFLRVVQLWFYFHKTCAFALHTSVQNNPSFISVRRPSYFLQWNVRVQMGMNISFLKPSINGWLFPLTK